MLITLEEIRAVFEIAEVVGTRLETAIKEAEKMDLKKVLGDPLYWDLKNNLSAQKYIKILDGGEYQDENNNTIEFEGLKKALMYYSIARLLNDSRSGMMFTRFDAVYKKTDYSERVPKEEKKETATELRNIAISHVSDVLKFLKLNLELYPLYDNKEKKKNTNQTKIIKVPLNKKYL